MEEGSFRCDANISIRPEGSTELMAKVEVKNMNSFRSVYRALEYEAKRQRQQAEADKRIPQETRGWVEDKGKTVSQRSKEYAHDYRYFPEPDLPPMSLSREWVAEIQTRLPELPDARRQRFVADYSLPEYDAGLLTSSREMAEYFEDCIRVNADVKPKEISNWLMGEVSRIMNEAGIDIEGFRGKVPPAALVELLGLNTSGTVNTAGAKAVLEEMFRAGRPAAPIVQELGLSQINDDTELEKAVIEAINKNSQAVADYRAGKVQAAKFLVGQVMKVTRGRANPAVVGEMIQKKLEEG
jgi:aspartyl-tRNA(Asn)/glutamyl-tRNA(Gln) amidotransferase subunit B